MVIEVVSFRLLFDLPSVRSASSLVSAISVSSDTDLSERSSATISWPLSISSVNISTPVVT